MRKTAEERREVVRHLRRGVSYMFLVNRWRNEGLDKVQPFGEYLADWIERPTCRNVLDEVNTFECSECHWSFYTENPDGAWEEPCYCIHCGAEVIENAD